MQHKINFSSLLPKILIAIFIIAFALFLATRCTPFPELREMQNANWSTRFVDSSGVIIQIIPLPNENGMRREFTPLENIPEKVVTEFINAEDKRFFSHHGIDLVAIIRATFQNKKENKTISGASTITMQLARIIIPSSKRTLAAKIKESWNALRIEARLNKKEILELYLNTIPFGFNTSGVTSAARFFFNIKEINPLEHLSDEQIIALAKIPRRPQTYAPINNFYTYPYLMPHYINYICKKISETENKFPPQINLSANINVHIKAEQLLANAIKQYEYSRLTNGAIIAIENKTGNILCWIGSGNFNDKKHQGEIDGVLVANQPGSSMKPFLYATAIENGFMPSTVLPDIQQEFGFSSVYIPRNFNNKTNGPVRLRVALASSLNIPAVWILNNIGMQKYLSTLLNLEFDSIKQGIDNVEFPQSHTAGLGIALGNAQVQLKELTRAFSVFPNDGNLIELNFSDEYLHNKNSKKIFNKDTARIICSILSDKGSRALGFGYAETFNTPFPSMFKTGTANQFQNITALAASPLYTVGVWMGNFTGETVIGKTGSSIPAKIAKEILVGLQGNTKIDFLLPENYSQKKICALSGMIANEHCPETLFEFIPTTSENNFLSVNDVCTWHEFFNGVLQTIYPAEYQTWFYSTNQNRSKRTGSINFSSSDLKIITPRNNSEFYFDPSIKKENQMLTVEATGGKENSINVFYDEKFLMQCNRPFNFSIPVEKGSHKVLIKCGNEIQSIDYVVN